MRRITQLTLVVVVSGLVGCSGGSQTLPLGNKTLIAPIENDSQIGTPIQYALGFPISLPPDTVQPWEELGSNGKVVSATGASSDFFAGQQTHLVSGDTSGWNGALRMASGGVGDGNLSYAMYRIPLGEAEPGVVSVDANLRPMGDGNIGAYYVGLADYGNNSWQWFGPVMDAHWRISAVQVAREAARFTSTVGSVFVCIVAHDGSALDIVGIGIDPVGPADTEAPGVPGGLVLTPVASGLEVSWDLVGGSDVAGYKVYYKDKAFGEQTAQFADTVHGLQGRSFILSAQRQTWVAVSAVDKSGNESALSAIEHALPLVGVAPQLDLEISTYSTQKGSRVILTATGANLYDWDLDGDGIFDILGDDTGSADVDTSQTGLIRPLVRGSGADSTSVALSAVSVIVSSNARPVAVANATPASGAAPLLVTFNGLVPGSESTDFDGEIVGGGWDFDGDGFYDEWDDADFVNVATLDHTYSVQGVYNAKLKVVDDEGAWDVDTVTVVVNPAPDPANIPPAADLTADVTSGDAPLAVDFYAGGSTDSDGTIVEYAWDWDGNGGYDEFSEAFTMDHTYLAPGIFVAKVRAEDNDGARSTATVEITVNVTGNELPVADLGATPTTGNFPTEIAFDAQASYDPDGSIVRYDYDFDGDDNYELYDGDDSPDWIYTSAGVFDAQVRVTDDRGAQDVASVQVTITGPPVAILHGSPLTGQSPVDVAFSAADSYDQDGSIVDYEWDFDGDGIYNETGAEADYQGEAAPPLQIYTAGLPVVASVRVTDNEGGTDTASLSITVHGWVTYTAIDLGAPAETWSNCRSSIARVGGWPAIACEDYDTGRLLYSRALDAAGASWSGTPVVADSGSGDSVGSFPSLAMVDGNPAIAYHNNTDRDLMYVRANDAAGDSWGTPLTLDATGTTGLYPALLVVSGNPAVGYDYADNDVMYVRATDPSGTNWGAPVTVDSVDVSGQYLSMAMVDNRPAISTRYWVANSTNVRFVRASDASGSAWDSPVDVNAPTTGANFTSMAVIGGFPAIAYEANPNGLMYVRATDAQGTAWGTPVTVHNTGDAGRYNTLTTVNGKPAICSSGNGYVVYIEALDSVGSSWEPFLTSIDYGTRGSMIEIDGKPAISYNDLNYPTSNEIKYATRY